MSYSCNLDRRMAGISGHCCSYLCDWKLKQENGCLELGLTWTVRRGRGIDSRHVRGGGVVDSGVDCQEAENLEETGPQI